MLHYSEDSSDEGKKLPSKRRKLSTKKHVEVKSENIKTTEISSTRHGIDARNSPNKKSPVKQSPVKAKIARKTNDSDSPKDSQHNFRKEHAANQTKMTVKKEPFSSESDSDDTIKKSYSRIRAKKNLFNDEADETAALNDEAQNINVQDINKESIGNSQDIPEREDSFDHIDCKKPTKQSKVIGKMEVILSKDDAARWSNDLNGSDTDYDIKKSSQQEVGGNSSDSEIAPSQFWLQQYKEDKREMHKKAGAEVPLDSTLTKNLDTQNRVELSKKILQKTSPSKVTSTEILDTKSVNIDANTIKTEPTFAKKEVRDTDAAIVEKEAEETLRVVKNDSDDNQLKNKILATNKPERPNKGKPDIVDNKFKKNLNGKKIEDLQKIKVMVKRKANKKDASNQNLNNVSNNSTLWTRPSICDDDTTSEEEEVRVDKQLSKNNKTFILGLEKPKKSNKNTSNSSATQMILVLHKNDQSLKNNTSDADVSKVAEQVQSSTRRRSTSNEVHVDNNDSSEDGHSTTASSCKTERKLSSTTTKPITDRSDEAEPNVAITISKQESQRVKHSRSTIESASAIGKSESDDDTSSDKEISHPRNTTKTSVKRRHPDDNSDQVVRNKQSRVIISDNKPTHDMSDSDTDSLTKLNTTLNKSVAFMENKKEKTVILNRSRKSVSINTKQQLTHIPNDAGTRKSILKKLEHPATSDNSEDVSNTQDQNIKPNVEVNKVKAKVVERPSDLGAFQLRESLAYDSTKASFSLDNISDDDEIYILDVPRTVDPIELKDQIVKLGGRSKLQIGNELYETCDKEATNISCVFRTNEEQCSYKTVNIKPAGYINVRQKLLRTLHVELSPCEKITVPFPVNLKIRHPLFGAEYKDQIIDVISNVKENASRYKKKTILLEDTKKEISTNCASSKSGKKPRKSKYSVKQEDETLNCSQQSNKSETKSKRKGIKVLPLSSDDSGSSDSDSNTSFFQKVKRTKTSKLDKKMDLNYEAPISISNLHGQSEEELKSSLSKKFQLSLNASAIKRENSEIISNNNSFCSSTPIKIENNIINNKNVSRKRKASDIGKREK